MGDIASYVDPVTGCTYPLAKPRWRSDDGFPLLVTPQRGLARADIDSSVRSLWRYARALPVPIDDPITLGEGCTPLVRRSLGGMRALFKLEWFAPSGSFKDRGASVMLSTLRQQGISHILEDSSGNGGSAISAYAAAGGMHAQILVPAATQAAKIAQIRVYGAELCLIEGDREQVAQEALRRAADIFYASHNWHAFFLEGTKTLAYELWEDLGFEAPDNIVVPTGAGSNILGCDLGFGELLRSGQIRKIPRLFAVQPANCAPLASPRLGSGEAVVLPHTARPTIAEGAAVQSPVRGVRVLDAVRRSGGRVVTVEEADIVEALFALAGIGFYVEPTAALGGAGLVQLADAGAIDPGETTVVILTGAGTKATDKVKSLLPGRA